VLICHCWHNFQSPIAGWTVCALKCYDNNNNNNNNSHYATTRA
jgi:hypothetical protein